MLAKGVELESTTPEGRHDLARPPQGYPILARAFPEPAAPATPSMPAAPGPRETSTRKPAPPAVADPDDGWNPPNDRPRSRSRRSLRRPTR